MGRPKPTPMKRWSRGNTNAEVLGLLPTVEFILAKRPRHDIGRMFVDLDPS